VTGLAWNLQGFATGDLIQLLGNTDVNAGANIARSAFFTAAMSSLLTAATNNTRAGNYVALFQEGDDVIFQIVASTILASLNVTQSAARGIGVIRFQNNTTLLANASGGGALSNVGISITQGLNGMTISFT